MAMCADHQQAGVARGLQDRAADVLLVHDHGARLDAVGVGSGARGVDRPCGLLPVERALPGRARAARVGHRDEAERVAGSHELRGLVHGLLRAAAVVDRADDPAEAELRADGDAGIDPDGDRCGHAPSLTAAVPLDIGNRCPNPCVLVRVLSEAGTRASTVVPSPGADLTRRRPSSSSTRSRMLTRPNPVAVALTSYPRPSSRTRTPTSSSISATAISTFCASACFRAFLSASCAIR